MATRAEDRPPVMTTTTVGEQASRLIDPDETAAAAEALIAEARARARRRRSFYTILALLVLLGSFAVAVDVVDRNTTGTSEPAARVADRAPAAIAGLNCLSPHQIPQVPDPLIGGGGIDEWVIAESSSAASSNGSPCQLVLRYGFHRFDDGARLHLSGKVWLFSDGRIILDTDRDGFVSWERRLTAEGVELMRSNAVAALGAPITTPEDALVSPRESIRSPIQYGDGRYYPRDRDEFVRQFVNLSWLPASAWQREHPVEYVPLWYATCYESLSAPLEPSAVHDLMTPRARQVLRTKVATDRYWWERTTPVHHPDHP